MIFAKKNEPSFYINSFNSFIRSAMSHAKKRCHQCTHCGKDFSRSKELKRRTRTHTGGKPSECRRHGKCFTPAEVFRKHQRTHTGHKHYECKQCGKGFNRAGTLREHINLFVILFDKTLERGEMTNNKWDFYWFIPTAI